MDTFLSPTNRVPELLDEEDDDVDVAFTEAELNVPVATLLSNSNCTWKSFSEIFDSFDVLWTSPDVFIAINEYGWWSLAEMFSLETDYINDDDASMKIHIYAQREHAQQPQQQITWLLDLLLNLLARYDQELIRIEIDGRGRDTRLPVSLPAFESLLAAPSRALGFLCLILDEHQCRAFATAPREDLHLNLWSCRFTDGAAAFLEYLRNNQGPSELTLAGDATFSVNNSSALTDALRRNTSIKILHIKFAEQIGDRLLRALFEGLKWNRGLSKLSFCAVTLNDENWRSLMACLEHHPSLRVLRLSDTVGRRLSKARKTARTRQMKNMMENNTVLSEISVEESEHDIAMIEKFIEPLLEINTHRQMIRAVKQEKDTSLRVRLLERALSMVADKHPTLVFMLLTENADLVAEAVSKESRLRKRMRDLEEEMEALDDEVAQMTRRRRAAAEEYESVARSLQEM